MSEDFSELSPREQAATVRQIIRGTEATMIQKRCDGILNRAIAAHVDDHKKKQPIKDAAFLAERDAEHLRIGLVALRQELERLESLVEDEPEDGEAQDLIDSALDGRRDEQ